MLDSELTALKTRVHAIVRPQPSLFTYYVITSLALLCAAPFALVPLYFRYHTLWYRFTDEGVSMGYGILFRRELQLTYARMQDIHLSQNVLERWLGIGTLTVQTAGSGEGGNLRIVGVRDVEAIRDYLYARMRGVRVDDHGETSTDALLVEIRDALTAAATALAKRAS
jgi:putative membrane protein